MSASHWHRVRDLFEAALEESPSDADGWLRARGADSDVRGEVLSLLDHHSRAADFLADAIVSRVPSLLEDEEEAFDPGAVVGHYRIDRELGRGAMGRVYLATDTRLGRAVALKALAPHLTGDASHRERLRREAQAAASLTHSGICTVYALEEIDGQLFIASELVNGHTLRDEMSRGMPRSAEAIGATARELADALASAHAKGIVHRDFKPENIMRNADGRLKILDFGLARIERRADAPAMVGATVPGALVGTPAYMSPEQLNGQPADARSDVFALGVVIYEYACGSHPFQAATPLAVAARVLESEPAPIASRSGSVPPAVGAVVDRCLRKTPRDRFESAGAIAEALRAGQASAPPSTSSAGPVPFIAMWRIHQLATMLLYVAMTTVAWWIKELLKPNAMLLAVFVALGLSSAAAGVMRGHLLFTSALNLTHLSVERRRLRMPLLTLDMLIAAGGVLAGLTLVSVRPLAGVLSAALAVGLALATLMMEPATTSAAFDHGAR
jgi:serine/threonine protein kinase